MKKRRVVITGLGVVAPNGIGKDEFWQATVQGKSGVDLVMSFDTSDLDTKIAAQILDFNPLNYISPEVAKKTDRFVHFGLASAKMALEDSGLDLENENRDRVGVIIGTVFGSILLYKSQMKAGAGDGKNRKNPFSVPKIALHTVSGYIAMELNITGLNLVISSGINAIGRSFRMIQNNEADILFTGGAEAPLTSVALSIFSDLNVLSKRNDAPEEASRPFDKERDGFVLGEGGAVLVLEELSHAVERNAGIYAEVIGYASNSGTYRMAVSEPDGKSAVQAMKGAVRDADINLYEVDYINSYGASIQASDRLETRYMKEVFGDYIYNIPVSSIKSMIGHTAGASGAIDAVTNSLATKYNVIPPTINYQYPDPECDLDYVPNKARKARVNTVLSNSFEFGNSNASIIFKRLTG